MTLPLPSELRELRDRYLTAREGFRAVDARFRRGVVTMTQWDRALTVLLKVQDQYILGLERRLRLTPSVREPT